MIYFCIPARNEERTVGVVLWKLRQVMTELQRDFQIIVVDDASTDATQEVIRPYARVLPLTLIINQQQLGFAASLEIAIREAVRRSPYPKRDALITLQADFTEDPDVVPALIKRIEAGADIVTTTVTLDEAAPKPVKYARRLFHWLLRGREWAQAGEPFSGFRAYRIMTIKRALEGRGAARVLSWEGWAAHAELLAQTAPHSRRNDAVESTLHYRRLQRPSRFRFMPMLSQVMGVRSGKPSTAPAVTMPDTTIAVPASLAVELATSHRREQTRGRREDPRRRGNARDTRPERGSRNERPARPARAEGAVRSERPPRPERPTRPERPARPERTPRPEAAPRAVVAASAIAEGESAEVTAVPGTPRKRRRPRRRSRKGGQPRVQLEGQPQASELDAGTGDPALMIASDNGSAPSASPAEGARKKSRRGRRGGRGRKRGPRPGAEGQSVESAPTESQTMEARDTAGEPPVA